MIRRLLEVTAPAASHDLTTLAAVKAELEIAEAGSDALLAALITQASRAAARHCNRVFAREAVTETLWLSGARPVALPLGRYPLAAVAAVREAGALLPVESYAVEPARGLLLRQAGGRPVAWGGRIEVDYTAGYALPGVGAGRDLPEDIERAALELVRAAWFARRRDPALIGEDLSGVLALRYESRPGGWPPAAVRLLAPYRSYAL
jgi:uncharacterized phiE125 gp8 family phage protein